MEIVHPLAIFSEIVCVTLGKQADLTIAAMAAATGAEADVPKKGLKPMPKTGGEKGNRKRCI